VFDRDRRVRGRRGGDGIGAGCEGRGGREDRCWADAARVARLWLLGSPTGRLARSGRPPN